MHPEFPGYGSFPCRTEICARHGYCAVASCSAGHKIAIDLVDTLASVQPTEKCSQGRLFHSTEQQARETLSIIQLNSRLLPPVIRGTTIVHHFFHFMDVCDPKFESRRNGRAGSASGILQACHKLLEEFQFRSWFSPCKAG